jgi:hypothetical protein
MHEAHTSQNSESNLEKQRWEQAKNGFNKNGQYITGAMWGLIHTYSSRAKMEEAMDLLEPFVDAVAKDDPSKLRAIGGLEGFLSRYLTLMQSDDDTVAGFSARVLAVIAGARYESQIAGLLTKRDKSWTDESAYPAPVARGQAAIALSIIGSFKYKQDIANLLKSMNQYDRSGAVYALGHLQANEYAAEIAGLLTKKGFTFRRDESPIHALLEMGVGAIYKKEFAQALDDDYENDVQQAAAFALAHLHAIEYSSQIARFLDDKYRRGWASKALAIMGAKEFVVRIAAIVTDNDSLDRSAALLSLGVLKATQYTPQITRLLRNKADFSASYNAALALTLMDVPGYEEEILARLATNKTGTYVDEGDLHPLVAEEAREINRRIRATLERFKTHKVAVFSEYFQFRATRRVGRDSRQNTRHTKRAGLAGA